MTLTQFAAVVWPAIAGGVSLDHVLSYVRERLTARLTSVATAVETGNVAQLRHDAAGVVDFVETHDPALAKAVEAKVHATEAAAQAEVEKARSHAAEELRKVASLLEGIGAPAPALTTAQAAPVTSPGTLVTPAEG